MLKIVLKKNEIDFMKLQKRKHSEMKDKHDTEELDWNRIWGALEGDDERIANEIDKKLSGLSKISREKIEQYKLSKKDKEKRTSKKKESKESFQVSWPMDKHAYGEMVRRFCECGCIVIKIGVKRLCEWRNSRWGP